MKKLYASFLIVFLSLIALTATAQTIHQLAAGSDLYTTYSNAGFLSGDIIELTTDGGAYSWGTKLGIATKSFTIRAAAGLTAKPILTLATPASAGAFFQINNSSSNVISITLDGVEIAGNANITAFIIAGKTTAGGNLTVSVNNCKFTGFTHSAAGDAYFSYANSQTTNLITSNFGDLTVTNSEFIGGYSVFSVGNATAGNPAVPTPYNTANNIKFINCNFKAVTNNCINHNTSPIKANSIIINHCTFDGCATVAAFKELSIGTTATTGAPAIIKNTLFANRGASTTANIYGGAGSETNVNNAVYYTGAGTLDAIYPVATLGDYITPGLNVDPVIGTNLEATASVYYNAGSDGKTIGYVASGITTAVPKSVKANKLTISQTGANFKINGIADAAFTVYSVGGSQVATGVIVDGNFQMTANKGIYILKSNGQVAKFAVR